MLVDEHSVALSESRSLIDTLVVTLADTDAQEETLEVSDALADAHKEGDVLAHKVVLGEPIVDALEQQLAEGVGEVLKVRTAEGDVSADLL